MDHINQTFYIPLYGKAFVSKKGIILHDAMAESIWQKEQFELKKKSKSKWLAYFMAMRSAVYDEWVQEKIKNNPQAVVLHIGCGMDSRILRIKEKPMQWYDIDVLAVIQERKKYYHETDTYQMLAYDMRLDDWKAVIQKSHEAIILLEGLSMYFKPDELMTLFTNLNQHFDTIHLLIDCYSTKAAQVSKYKNPINDVGVHDVYGYDDPKQLATDTGFVFEKEYCMTPQKYINELQGLEKMIFKTLFAGKFAKSLYKIYAFKNKW